MPKNLKQKFIDFCKKYGRLTFERRGAQYEAHCYIKPETIIERSSEFNLDFTELVKAFAGDWFSTVIPRPPEVTFGLYKFPVPKQAKGVHMELITHKDTEEVEMVFDYENLYIRGKKDNRHGCGLRVGKDGTVSTYCLYVTPEYADDVRISSVSSYANI